MKKYRASQVFVPGGMPKYTYVAREERKLETRIRAAADNLCKLVTVTGATKSGKTVLVNRVFPRSKTIWVDGGAAGSEDDFWGYVLEGLSGFTGITNSSSGENAIEVQGGAEGKAGVPFVASGKVKTQGGYSRKKGKQQSKSLRLSARSAAISQLRGAMIPLVIDDFHYLDRKFQGNIIRAIKPLIFEGLPVVIIAIPHRRYDAIKVEREMTGRLESVVIPSWEHGELEAIPKTGFPLLNTEISSSITHRYAEEAYGSPHLMQEFCRELCRINHLNETPDRTRKIKSAPDDLFQSVAEQTGKVVFDRLSKGPRQRSDRLQRKLKSGETADIYEVVLLALVNLKPGLDTIDYESLRGSIREILASDLPQAHEVTRVLGKMADIASSDEASTPVVDWEEDEQRLHITDPYFAYYLKWGSHLA